MDIALIKNKISTVLNSAGYSLFDVTTYEEEGEKILSVILDESLDLEQISAISPQISKVLAEDKNLENYLVDVTCVGIERPLRTLEEVALHRGEYICLELLDGEEILGDLLNITNEEIKLEVKIKNRTKEIIVPYKEVKNMRLAVKF